MATFVGKTGNTYHYADTVIAAFGWRALHVEVRVYQHGEPHTVVREIGRVGHHDQAVDKVAAIVKRKRELLALLNGGNDD